MKKSLKAIWVLLICLFSASLFFSCGKSKQEKLLDEYENLVSEYISLMKDYSKDPTNAKLLKKSVELSTKSLEVYAQLEELEDELSDEEWKAVEKRILNAYSQFLKGEKGSLSTDKKSAKKDNKKKNAKVDNSPNAETDFDFKANDDFSEIKITGYKGERTNVVIPAEIQGIPVTKVNFTNPSQNLLDIESIVFPEGVVAIGFYTGENISSVKLPSTLKCIWELCPYGMRTASKLESIELPEGLEFLQGLSDTGIKELKLPESLKYIAHIERNNELSSIIIPENFNACSSWGEDLSDIITGDAINSSIALQKQLKNIHCKALKGDLETVFKEYYIY